MSCAIPNPSLSLNLNLVDDDSKQQDEADTNPKPDPNPEKEDEDEDEEEDGDGDEEDEDEKEDGDEEDEDEDEKEDDEGEESDCEAKPQRPPPPEEPPKVALGNNRKILLFTPSLLNIESVDLFIKPDRASRRSHEIYGKIAVSGRLDKAFALYDRKEDEAEVIPQGEVYHLSLCGPRHSLPGGSTNQIYVRLYERGSPAPFLEEDLYFHFSYTRYEDDRATLVVNFTRIPRSLPFKILISLPTGEPQSTISGQVYAIIKCGSLESTCTLFKRLEGKGVQLSPGGLIPLDRSLAVAPFQGFVTGDTSEKSLTIVVDLCFEELGKQLNGRTSYAFSSADRISMFPLRRHILLKHKCPQLDATSSAPDHLDIVVYPFYDYYNSREELDDEEWAVNFEPDWVPSSG